MHLPGPSGSSGFQVLLTFFVSGILAAQQVLLQPPASPSETNLGDPILSSKFYGFVEGVRNKASIPGISVGVVRLDDDKQPVTRLASWGRKTEDGDGHDLTPDTLFAIASCSKAFLATSFGLLIDDFSHGRNVTPLPSGVSRFDWDTKIASMLPDEWGLGDEWTTRSANFRDAFGHVTGLPRYDYTYKEGDTSHDLLLRMRNLRTAYELREKWSYNNQMFVLGAHVIEKYANTTWLDFVEERLLKPLNMSTTTTWPSRVNASGKLTHTWTKTGRRIPFWCTDEVSRFMAGAGGVISSAEDMVKWLATLLNQGVDPVSGEVIFPRDVYDTVTTARQVLEGAPTSQYGVGIAGYGMGWTQSTYDEIQLVSHNGGLPGFSTLTAFSPSSNLGIVVLINADEQGEHAWAILRRAFDDVLDRTSSKVIVDTPTSDVQDLSSKLGRGPPPSLDLEAYTGTYTSRGHGTVTLCSSRSTSRYCSGVLADFSTLHTLEDSPFGLYSVFKSVLSTHMRLRHLSGDTFTGEFTTLFPNGYGKDTTAFETFETGDAESTVVFSVEGSKVAGFSLVIDEAAVAARQKRTGGHIEETADAWFEKV
ncbi:beta-lactamase/transpeptidase-like protein [Trametes meyenii]|nr:beta-lactamase/transpeptidase-like protein [Trametes meyenii]